MHIANHFICKPVEPTAPLDPSRLYLYRWGPHDPGAIGPELPRLLAVIDTLAIQGPGGIARSQCTHPPHSGSDRYASPPRKLSAVTHWVRALCSPHQSSDPAQKRPVKQQIQNENRPGISMTTAGSDNCGNEIKGCKKQQKEKAGSGSTIIHDFPHLNQENPERKS